MSCGLVLEGGANRGIFTAGVLDFFQQKGLYLPYVIAVSVGSNNAIDYVSKQIGRTKDCLIPNGRNTPPIHWKHLFRVKSIVNLDLAFDRYPNHLVPFDYQTFFDSSIRCEFVATNCITGKAEYLSEKEDKKRLMKICQASCSMPYLCAVHDVDDTPYLDGGISDAIPIKRALEVGMNKCIVVLTREAGFKKPSVSMRHVNSIMYRDYPNLIYQLNRRTKDYNESISFLSQLEAMKTVFVVRPTEVLISRTNNNKKKMGEFYLQGYNVAKSLFSDIKDFVSN